MVGTDQVGIPIRFARRLTYPEPVTTFNAEELANMVRVSPSFLKIELVIVF